MRVAYADLCPSTASFAEFPPSVMGATGRGKSTVRDFTERKGVSCERQSRNIDQYINVASGSNKMAVSDSLGLYHRCGRDHIFPQWANCHVDRHTLI